MDNDSKIYHQIIMSEKKKAVAKKKAVVKRHPLGGKLTTIEKQIQSSDLFKDATEFIMRLSGFVQEEKPKGSIQEIMQSFTDKLEMFVTEKDRVQILVQNKLKVKVNAISETNGVFKLNVTKSGEKTKQAMWVKKIKEGYEYGIQNFTIGKV